MKTEQAMVAAFHEKAGATINEKPANVSKADCALRIGLIHEEFTELCEAMGVEVDYESLAYKCRHTLPSHQLTLVADALGDLLYVILGTAVCCGIDLEPCFHEIHRSNMSKFIDGHRRADGKWIKGPSYSPADLAPILDAQPPLSYLPKSQG